MVGIQNLTRHGARHGVILFHSLRRDADLARTDCKQAVCSQIGLESSAQIDVLTKDIGDNIPVLIRGEPPDDLRTRRILGVARLENDACQSTAEDDRKKRDDPSGPAPPPRNVRYIIHVTILQRGRHLPATVGAGAPDVFATNAGTASK